MNRTDFYKRYWLLIDEILDKLEIERPREEAKQRAHETVKYCLGVKSLTSLKEEEWPEFLIEIRVTMAELFGWMLKEPGEYADVENMDMKTFLKYKLK